MSLIVLAYHMMDGIQRPSVTTTVETYHNSPFLRIFLLTHLADSSTYTHHLRDPFRRRTDQSHLQILTNLFFPSLHFFTCYDLLHVLFNLILIPVYVI